jgi:small subunit ribosomal protein S15
MDYIAASLETFGNICYSTLLMITAEKKAQAFALTQTHKNDVGSPQAQASVLTVRIKEITEHLKVNKHDHMARRGLVQMVGRRKRLLKYLEAKDFEAYKAVVAKLGLRK